MEEIQTNIQKEQPPETQLKPCTYAPFSGRCLCDKGGGTFKKGKKNITCPCKSMKEYENTNWDEPIIIAFKIIEKQEKNRIRNQIVVGTKQEIEELNIHLEEQRVKELPKVVYENEIYYEDKQQLIHTKDEKPQWNEKGEYWEWQTAIQKEIETEEKETEEKSIEKVNALHEKFFKEGEKKIPKDLYDELMATAENEDQRDEIRRSYEIEESFKEGKEASWTTRTFS